MLIVMGILLGIPLGQRLKTIEQHKVFIWSHFFLGMFTMCDCELGEHFLGIFIHINFHILNDVDLNQYWLIHPF
jgi:uncharacterized membrane protein